MRAEKKLARFLGWLSLALGIPQVLMPGRVARLIGVRDDEPTRAWMRAVGVRELVAAGGILSRRRPVGWLSARAAGDVMDLALLGVAMTRVDTPRRRFATSLPEEDRRRIANAIGAVGGVLAADAIGAAALTRQPRDAAEQGPLRVRAAVTVLRGRDEVQQAWLDMHDGDGIGEVRFLPAPGGRGTEIHVDARADVPADAVGATAAKLVGKAPEQRVEDELRRFKQVLEAGEIARSDASPEGTDARRQIKQRPAQPLAERLGSSDRRTS